MALPSFPFLLLSLSLASLLLSTSRAASPPLSSCEWSGNNSYMTMVELQRCLAGVPLDEATRNRSLDASRAAFSLYVFRDLAKLSPSFDKSKAVVPTKINIDEAFYNFQRNNYSNDFQLHQDLTNLAVSLHDLNVVYQKPACYGRVTMKQPFILASRLNAAGNQVLIVDSIERSLKTFGNGDLYANASAFVGFEVHLIGDSPALDELESFGKRIGFSRDSNAGFNAALRLYTSRNLGSFNLPTSESVMWRLRPANASSSSNSSYVIATIPWTAVLDSPWSITSENCLSNSTTTPSASPFIRQSVFFSYSLNEKVHFDFDCWNFTTALSGAVIAGVLNGTMVLRIARFPASNQVNYNFTKALSVCAAAYMAQQTNSSGLNATALPPNKPLNLLIDLRTVLDSPAAPCQALGLLKLLTNATANLPIDFLESPLMQSLKAAYDLQPNKTDDQFRFFNNSEMLDPNTNARLTNSGWFTNGSKLSRGKFIGLYSQLVKMRRCDSSYSPSSPPSPNSSVSSTWAPVFGSVAVLSDGLCSGACAHVAYLLQRYANATMVATGGLQQYSTMLFAASPGGYGLSYSDIRNLAGILGVQSLPVIRGSLSVPMIELYADEAVAMNPTARVPLEVDYGRLVANKRLWQWWQPSIGLYQAAMMDLGWIGALADAPPAGLEAAAMYMMIGAAAFVVLSGVLAAVGMVWSQRISMQYGKRSAAAKGDQGDEGDDDDDEDDDLDQNAGEDRPFL